jgi:hypothetical protein
VVNNQIEYNRAKKYQTYRSSPGLRFPETCRFARLGISVCQSLQIDKSSRLRLSLVLSVHSSSAAEGDPVPVASPVISSFFRIGTGLLRTFLILPSRPTKRLRRPLGDDNPRLQEQPSTEVKTPLHSVRSRGTPNRVASRDSRLSGEAQKPLPGKCQ